jgi:uncharacterized protein (TIGR03437 family)
MRLILALALACGPLTAQFSSFSIAGTDPVLQAVQGRVLEFPVPVRGGVAPYRFFIAGDTTVPAGISLGASSGVLRVAAGNVGYFRVEVCAEDVSKATVCATYLVRVASPGSAAPIVLASGRVNNFYDRLMEGAAGNQVEISVGSGALPPGVNLNTFGRIVGTPLAPGAYGFTLRARDTLEGETTIREYLWTIDGPALQTLSLPNGFLDTAYSAPLAAAGGTGPYTWTLLRGPLPAGFALSADGRLSGRTPVAGTYTFLVRVADTLSSAFDREVRVVIAPTLEPLRITTANVPPGLVGVAYRFAMDAAGGRAPYAWRVASGQLPAGLVMSGAGVISGTPAGAGSSTVQVELRDLSGASAVRSYPVQVLAGLTVTTGGTLPAATRGVAYRVQLAAGGGTAPYQWSLAGGRLPMGLALGTDGVLGGVPGEVGQFSFGVRVTDGAGASTVGNLALAVNAAPPVIVSGGVVNAASFAGGAIAPGEIITVFAGPLGAETVQVFTLDGNGRVPTRLAGTRLLVDGVAAPLLYVAPGQLSAIVPYGVSGKATVPVAVEANGLVGPAVPMAVAGSAPAIFTADASGRGPAAALGTGNVVTLYVTGEGVLQPVPEDGSVVGERLPRPVLPVRVLVGGREAEVLYAGGAPGLVAGVMQVNVRVPEGLRGEAIPVSIRVGSAESPAGVTIRYFP